MVDTWIFCLGRWGNTFSLHKRNHYREHGFVGNGNLDIYPHSIFFILRSYCMSFWNLACLFFASLIIRYVNKGCLTISIGLSKNELKTVDKKKNACEIVCFIVGSFFHVPNFTAYCTPINKHNVAIDTPFKEIYVFQLNLYNYRNNSNSQKKKGLYVPEWNLI